MRDRPQGLVADPSGNPIELFQGRVAREAKNAASAGTGTLLLHRADVFGQAALAGSRRSCRTLIVSFRVPQTRPLLVVAEGCFGSKAVTSGVATSTPQPCLPLAEKWRLIDSPVNRLITVSPRK